MATQWQTANSVWLEDDATGQFELAATRGLGEVVWRPVNRVEEVAQWLAASLPVNCQCAPIYPEGFAFCPQCGQALRMLPRCASEAWYGPYADHALPEHAIKGLALSAAPLAHGVPQRNTYPDGEHSLPAPSIGRCVFASADFGFAAPHLLALGYRQNVLQYWDAHAEDWQLLAGNGADLRFTASDYYWLKPLDQAPGSVAVVPTAQGLMRLMLNPLNLSYRLLPLLAQTLVSAPGRVFEHLACLYKSDQSGGSGGSVRLWTRAGAHEGASVTDHACALPDDAAFLGGWSRPIAYQGRLMWLHKLGHLLWQPGSAPQWLAWPPAWQPRLAYAAPMQSRDGRLWLLGQQEQGQAYVFVELGSVAPQMEAADGARLGFANFVFRLGHPVHGEPWESFTVEDENDHHALVWPLLACYDSESRTCGGLVLRLPNHVGTVDQLLNSRSSHDSKLEWVGDRQIELERMSVARPWELSCFLHQDKLYLHHPDWDQMRAWRWQAAQ